MNHAAETPTPTPPSVTGLLERWREGDAQALDRLTPLVYDELRRLARSHLRRERPDHTLQPTALVHEAYLALQGKERPRWKGRVHFYSVAAQQMRRILVDHARAHQAAKRGGDYYLVPLESAAQVAAGPAAAPLADLLALDQALEELAQFDPRRARILELRCFAGLTLEETAQALEVSIPLVVKEQRLARAWLAKELKAVAAGSTGRG